MNDNPPSTPGVAPALTAWPVVSASDIRIAEWDYDLAYMGVYVRLEICNASPYLVREATLRIDGKGQTKPGVVTTRELVVGPLFPGVYVHEEQGIGAREGISGLSFDSVSAHAVRLTPPSEMVAASEYPALQADVLSVIEDDMPDLRPRDDGEADEPRMAFSTAIRIRVRNGGPAVVERARLKLVYFEARGEEAAEPGASPREPVAEWIFDMPRPDWNPYGLPAAPDAGCDPADPLPPGREHEFTIVHYQGGPHGWEASLDAVSVQVCEVKLGVCAGSSSGSSR